MTDVRGALLCCTAGGLLYWLTVRRWQLQWGATTQELRASLPGDDLVAEPNYVTTRAVTINALPGAVWPWIVQLGQGRGGFYTYDRFEQIAGTGIRSADRVLPEFQDLHLGDSIPLSPAGGPRVAILEPGRTLVLHDIMDLRTGRSIPPDAQTTLAIHWTWCFVLEHGDHLSTRLLVRTRAALMPRLVCVPASILVLEPVHFLMERGMLLGIRSRAQGSASLPGSTGAA